MPHQRQHDFHRDEQDIPPRLRPPVSSLLHPSGNEEAERK
jgi:hypothetical protein